MKEKLSWHKISTAFEYGDLTPLAVAISVAHYGPVLASHGDNVAVAWAVGTLIDLLHFRTVRRLFQVTGRNRVVGHALVAVVTTAMALGYHLRFYDGDWLLAIPIPIGIAILAQHAAAQKVEQGENRWRKRVRTVIKIARRFQDETIRAQAVAEQVQAAANQLQAETNRLQARVNELQEQSKSQQEIIKAWQSLNKEAQVLARYNAKLLTAEQAASMIGVKDPRTVQSRAEKLNGVAK